MVRSVGRVVRAATTATALESSPPLSRTPQRSDERFATAIENNSRNRTGSLAQADRDPRASRPLAGNTAASSPAAGGRPRTISPGRTRLTPTQPVVSGYSTAAVNAATHSRSGSAGAIASRGWISVASQNSSPTSPVEERDLAPSDPGSRGGSARPIRCRRSDRAARAAPVAPAGRRDRARADCRRSRPSGRGRRRRGRRSAIRRDGGRKARRRAT